MTGRIRLLPDDLINRIAAGEVVERPGSILKELMENSLDAGADRIEVECEQGGKRLVRVADNGSGMDEDELLMCLQRHATSKLSPDSDLTDIRTLGFRGEAIPAIASVSRMTITTSRGGSEGRAASLEGGKLLSVYPAPANRGTTVEVRDLFFNTPARRKFLKTVQTEEGHLADACQRYALSRPELALSLHADGREMLRVSAGDGLRARLREAVGYLSDSLSDFSREAGKGISVCGSVTGPEASARSAAALFVFVCGRPVKDRLLTRAVIQGYGRTLPRGRYPAGAVFIDLDPADVDVNVHPAKTEVRFKNPGLVFSAVSEAVSAAVTAPPSLKAPWNSEAASGDWADGLPDAAWGAQGFGEPSGGGEPSGDAEGGALGAGRSGEGRPEPRSRSGPPMARASGGLPAWLSPPGGAAGAGSAAAGAPAAPPDGPPGDVWEADWDAGPGYPPPASAPPETGPAEPRTAREAGAASDGSDSSGAPDGSELDWEVPGPAGEGAPMFQTAPAVHAGTAGTAEGGDPAPAGASGGPAAAGKGSAGASGRAPGLAYESSKVLDDGGPPALRPIAQLARTYILAESPDGLRIIDQHAAHERILFNRLKLLLERDGLPSRNVLIPDTFELHPHERAALERVLEPLEHLGFRLEPFGEGTWVLKGVPRILSQQAAAEALREILSSCRGSYGQLDGAGAGESVKEVSEAWLHSVACRAAIKAGHDLPLEDMKNLLSDMYEAEAGGYCPHGRPSSLSITYDELEKKFGRK